MKYKVALIQNDSEMLRYSWADIRPMVEEVGYDYDSFTSENISTLFSNGLQEFDAIVIASNACNDVVIKENLDRFKKQLSSFLFSGKGLFVSMQMRLADQDNYQFLPEGFDVNATNRILLNEDLSHGNLIEGEKSRSNPILIFPNKISLEQVKRKCLNNQAANGLYWTFLTPEVAENYTSIIVDNKIESRNLLISSREDYPFRIVISSLAVDWQRLDNLWVNVLKYVVEGVPSIAFISKSGVQSFDYKFLLSGMQTKKVPHKEYFFSKIDVEVIATNVHNTYILDPFWEVEEVKDFSKEINHLLKTGKARILYLRKSLSENVPELTLVSNFREFQLISNNALIWLVSQFPTGGKGFWGGSFWYTLDVITTLIEFGYPTDYYKERVLKEIQKHYVSGSYDSVLGATCAMLDLFIHFEGNRHSKIKEIQKWILDNYSSKSLFEQATALDVLFRNGFVKAENQLILDFKSKVMNSYKSLNNEFALFRFCQTFLSCEMVEDAKILSLELNKFQNKNDGKWLNISHTAAIVEMLSSLQKRTTNRLPEVDTMIFKGVEYLRANYNPKTFNWNNNISSTAKSLKALHSFENLLNYSFDSAASLILFQAETSRSLSALEVSSELNLKMLQINSELNKKNNELKNNYLEELKANKFLKNFSFSLVILSLPLLVAVTFWLIWLLSVERLNTLFHDFVQPWYDSNKIGLLSVVAIVVFFSVVYLLNRIGILPKWFKEMVKPILALSGIGAKIDIDKKDSN